MTYLLRLLLFAILGIIPLGCAGNAAVVIVSGTGRAPIDEQLLSQGHQGRIVPWDTLELTSEMRFKVTPVTAGEWSAANSPGLMDAEARLAARRAAQVDLARRVARLPASEPAPGETIRPTVEEFAEKRPSVTTAVESAIAGAWTEQVGRDKQGNGVVVLQLPLRDVAAAVLTAGGGFSEQSDIARSLDSRARAQKTALDRARNDLATEILQQKGGKKLSIGEWVTMFPGNRNMLKEQIENARVVRSEKQPADTGEGSEWVVELEVDLTEIRAEIENDEEQYKKQLKRVEKAAKDQGVVE